MRSDLTDVTVVMDRSGSMASCREEAEGGLNHFVEEQAKQPGKCLFTLVQFDTEYEFVHRGVPIKDVPKFTLAPRGFTAMLDAIGRAINETGARLAAMPEGQRPGLVVFVILTDGMENASKEFTLAQVRQMIERQQKDYSWKFTFLGANIDAFSVGASIGIAAQSSASYSVGKTSQTFGAVAQNVCRMRSASLQGLQVESHYTDAERKAMA